MFILFFLIYWISPLFSTSSYLILSQNNYPYVICDPSSSSFNYSGIEVVLLRIVFQNVNMKESEDYEFICANSNSSSSGKIFANIGGLPLTQSNFPYSTQLFSKGFSIILMKTKEIFFFSKIINIGFYGILFVIPFCVGILIFFLTDNGLNVFYNIWSAYKEMFFVKPMINIKRTYLILFQGLLRYFLVGLLFAGVLNFFIVSIGFFLYKYQLDYKIIQTMPEYDHIVYEKNAFPILIDENLTMDSLENIINNSQENALFGVDYLWALHLKGKFDENIDIISTDLNVNGTFIEFQDPTEIELANLIIKTIKSLKKTNIQTQLINNFFNNNNGDKKEKQIDKLYILWIILGLMLFSILLWKFIAKFVKKPLSFFYKNNFKTVDLLRLRIEINDFFIHKTTKFLDKFSNESMSMFKIMKKQFIKRQFRDSVNPKETPNLMFLNLDINKNSGKIQTLLEAQKSIRILEDVKYYESDKFLKKRKKKISILKTHQTNPSLTNMMMIPKKKSIMYQGPENFTLKVQKARTLYEVILENIKKTFHEKKINVEDNKIEILTPTTNNLDINRKRSFKSFQNALNSKKLGSMLSGEQPSKKLSVKEVSYIFREDIIFKEEEEKKDFERNNLTGNLHNLPYVSSTHNMLVNSNNSILEGFKRRVMNKDKNGEFRYQAKIVEMEEEEKMSSQSKNSNMKLSD